MRVVSRIQPVEGRSTEGSGSSVLERLSPQAQASVLEVVAAFWAGPVAEQGPDEVRAGMLWARPRALVLDLCAAVG